MHPALIAGHFYICRGSQDVQGADYTMGTITLGTFGDTTITQTTEFDAAFKVRYAEVDKTDRSLILVAIVSNSGDDPSQIGTYDYIADTYTGKCCQC